MSQLTIPKGDFGFNIAFELEESDGTAFNGTGYTPTLKVWEALSSGTVTVTGACSWITQAEGKCAYEVQDGDFDEAGIYSAEVECTKTGARESFGPFRITVTESA